MKRILLLLIAFLALQLSAQQQPIVRQYMVNKTSFNPAFVGSDENISIALLYAHQWAGFEGAPHNIFARIHAPIKKGSVALGLTIYNEQLGVHNNTNITAQFAYRILLKKERRIVFGVQASVGISRENGNSLTTTFVGDDIYKQDITTTRFNAGVGVAYYSKNVWIGLAVPQLLRNQTNYAATDNKIEAAKFNFNIAGGYNFRVKDFGLSPSFIMRHSADVKFMMDLNLNFKYKEVFWVGPFYRINTSYGLLIGVAPTKWMKIGYAGELAQQTTLMKNNYGTHEIMLGFNVVPKGSKVSQSPRYF